MYLGDKKRMSRVATVAIHASQFPENVRRDLLNSLQSRRINHKFHYDSLKQAQRWLALHEALSPASSEPGCAAVYERAFETAHAGTDGCAAHVIALGCGGGEKDAHLLEALSGGANKLLYSPVDVSVAMVLAAREAALKVLGADNCFPVVCDLPGVADWEEILPSVGAQLPRVITFFGMKHSISW